MAGSGPMEQEHLVRFGSTENWWAQCVLKVHLARWPTHISKYDRETPKPLRVNAWDYSEYRALKRD